MLQIKGAIENIWLANMQLPNYIVSTFNHIPALIVLATHIKSVKYSGLVSFGHSLDLFVYHARAK